METLKNEPKKNIVYLVKETFREFNQDDTWTLGAALSYYTVFSIAPILVIVIAVAGIAFGQEAITGQVAAQLSSLLGHEGAILVQDMIKAAYKPGQSQIATVVAVLVLLFGATTLFGELQSSLNKIWEVKAKPKRGILAYIRDRLLSFSLILAVGFLLLVSLVLHALLVAFSNYLTVMLGLSNEILLKGLEVVLSLGVTTLLLAMIYKFLPDANVQWSDVWAGAFVTALLFSLGKFIIGFYIGQSNLASAYGAAGSLVLVLVWVNYSSQILFLGAEFTQVYAKTFGHRIKPAEYAVRSATVEVEQGDSESAKQFEKKVEKAELASETPEQSAKREKEEEEAIKRKWITDRNETVAQRKKNR